MWPFRRRHPLLVPVTKGSIPSFARPTGYTFGEAAALVAPLVGLDPEVPAAYLILAMPQDGSFRVCGNVADPASHVSLLGSALDAVALTLRDADGAEAS
jgi:hypothetical protein